jgi:predicted DNA-binding protein with PD1-like motif
MQSHHFGDGRYALRLDAGEDLIPTLSDFVAEAGIEAGVVSGLGSVDQIVLAFLDPETREYLKRRFDERMEVASLSGSISRLGDEPFVHLHAVVSPREMLAYAGHVHAAKVGAILEVFVTAFPGRLDRHAVPGLPFPGLFLPGEKPPAGEAAGT